MDILKNIWECVILKRLLKIISFIVVLLLLIYKIGICRVTSESMFPTFKTGSYLLEYKTKQIKRGDIITFRKYGIGEDLVKRCVAVSGDTLQIKNDTLFVNGKAPLWINVRNLEKRLSDDTFTFEIPFWQPKEVKTSWTNSNYGVLVIPKAKSEKDKMYFVLGDNRLNSLDSRRFGCVKKTEIIGKILFVLKR